MLRSIHTRHRNKVRGTVNVVLSTTRGSCEELSPQVHHVMNCHPIQLEYMEY